MSRAYSHTLRCEGGRRHKWVCVYKGQHDPTKHGEAWHPPSWDRCSVCGISREEIRWECRPFSCENYGSTHSRWLTRSATYESWKEWGHDGNVLKKSQGDCGMCLLAHERDDEEHAQRIRDETDLYRYQAAWERKEDQRAETKKELEWQRALTRAERKETARQRALLRDGHQTLTAIRRHLRGQDRSPLPASRPARTSPTS